MGKDRTMKEKNELEAIQRGNNFLLKGLFSHLAMSFHKHTSVMSNSNLTIQDDKEKVVTHP